MKWAVFQSIVLMILLSALQLRSESLNLNNTGMKKLEWIADKWINKDNESETIESWEIINDSLFEGKSVTIKNGKEVFSEKLKIEKQGPDIFYVADVAHNPAPVSFRLVTLSDTAAVFENMEHDFPKRITYKYESGSLHAWIEGPAKDGAWKKIDFFMQKMR